MRLDEFDYALPPGRIAQEPAPERDGSRLMVLDRATGRIDHKIFRDLPSSLRCGDLLVLNDSRVVPARLLARKPGGGVAEVLFLERIGEGQALHSEEGVEGAEGPSRTRLPLEGAPDRSAGDPSRATGDSTARSGAEPAREKSPDSLRKEASSGVERWSALVRGFARGAGETEFPGGLRISVEGREPDGEVARVAVRSRGAVEAVLREAGLPPIPPYIRREPGDARLEADRARYQTVYAESPGAVAAPTAGLHFTRDLLDAVRGKGIAVETLTLHVGWGTFQPVRAERLEDHAMHAERFSIPGRLAAAILSARERGGRVVAVGTTVARALEHAAAIGGERRSSVRESERTDTERIGGGEPVSRRPVAEDGPPVARGSAGPRPMAEDGSAMTGCMDAPVARGVVSPGSGLCDLFIRPGHAFRVVDALVTNFHLPRSTLLVLVCAFAGRGEILRAYEEAVRLGYRFYSYGDAMVIL